MKLKTLKLHVYELQPKEEGDIYFADRIHSGIVIRNGICEEVKEVKNKQRTKKAKK